MGVLSHLEQAEVLLIGRRKNIDAQLSLIQQAKEVCLAWSSGNLDGLASVAPRLARVVLPHRHRGVFAVPKRDPVTGEPVYDPRVVRGYKRNRQRVIALTRVYGPVIRGRAAGRAIFESGETHAASVESAAANLNALAKHKSGEFTRDSGTYTYHGDIDPDVEMIALVSGELDSDSEHTVNEAEMESQAEDVEDANDVSS